MASDLSKIESAVSTIQSNSVNIEQALSGGKLDSIITALQNLDKGISSTSSSKKGGNSLPANFSGMSAMLKTVNLINPKLQTFSTNISTINRGLKSLSATLDKINSNFLTSYKSASVGNDAGRNNGSTARNGLASNGGSFDSIKEVLTDIYNEIVGFRNDFLAVSARTGDASIDEKLAEIRKADALERIKERELEEKIKKGEATRNDKKELRKIQKNRELVERTKSGKDKKPGGVAGAIGGGMQKIGKFMTSKPDSSAMIDSAIGKISQMGGFGAIAGGILSLVKAGVDMVAKIQKAGGTFARQHGGGKYQQDQFITTWSSFAERMPTKMGYAVEEFEEATSKLTEATGRIAMRRTQNDMERLIDLKRFGIEGETIGGFDTFGKSAGDTHDYFAKLYGRAGRVGLSFKKLTDSIKNNLKLAQRYTFSKGLDGLSKMAEQSVRLKFNMTETAKLADKVSTVEGAMKTAANLSVLGGNFSRFSDPMNLMYMGLNDIEGLQDLLVTDFKDRAFWDEEKGQFDISSLDRVIMKAASEAMGVDYGEMTNIALNNAREDRIRSQISGPLDEDTIKYIVNLAQFDKEGNAYISGNAFGDGETPVYLRGEDFSALKDILEKESEKRDKQQGATLGDIYIQTADFYETIDKWLQGILSKVGAILAHLLGITSTNEAQDSYLQMLEKYKKDDYDDLVKKYGGKKQLEQAAAMGIFDEEINNYVGGEDVVKYFTDKYVLNTKIADAMHQMHEKKGDYYNEYRTKDAKEQGRKESYSAAVSAVAEAKALGDSSVKTHGNGGVMINAEEGEAILSRDTVRRFGVDNIKAGLYGGDPFVNKVSNVMDSKMAAWFNPMNVKPSNSLVTSSSSKISFEPLTVNIGGKFDLVANGRTRSINLDDYDTRELKKIIMATVTENIPTIMRKSGVLTAKGYDKENDPYRGSYVSV